MIPCIAQDKIPPYLADGCRIALIAAGLACAGSMAIAQEDDWADDLQAAHIVNPEYPQIAAYFGTMAQCRALYDISETGRAENLCVKCATVDPEGMPQQASQRIAYELVQSVEVALSQWTYAPADFGYRGVRTAFVFIMHGQEADALPEPPVMASCRGLPIS